jgi:hypothetical protein
MMKSRSCVILVVVLQALACAQPVSRFPTSQPSIEGWVTAINQTGEGIGTIRVEERPTESAGSAKAVVRITPTTEILRPDSMRVDFRSFVIGQWVRVWFIGPVRESYPVQADAATVIINPTIAEPLNTSSDQTNR